MIDRLWITGALLACLFSAGVVTLLVFSFLRFHSRTVIFHLITLLGAIFLLISGILRVVPAIRFYGDGNMLGYRILSVAGIGVLTYGLLNFAVEIIGRDNSQLAMPPVIAVSLTAAGIMAAGMILNFPVIVGISDAVGIISAVWAAVFVLSGRRWIVNRMIRRFSSWIGVSVLITAPFALFRIYLWNRSVDPFGYSYPPYLLMVFMFVGNGATLIVSSLAIVRNSRRISTDLDSEAIAAYEITPRECDIILYICRGCSNEEIGSRLFISPSTVKNHVYHIYRKTGARNRIELMNTVLSSKEAV